MERGFVPKLYHNHFFFTFGPRKYPTLHNVISWKTITPLPKKKCNHLKDRSVIVSSQWTCAVDASTYSPPMTECVVCFSVSRTRGGGERRVGSRSSQWFVPAILCVASGLTTRVGAPHHVRRGMIVRAACDDTQSWLRCFFTWAGW